MKIKLDTHIVPTVKPITDFEVHSITIHADKSISITYKQLSNGECLGIETVNVVGSNLYESIKGNVNLMLKYTLDVEGNIE